MGQTDPVTKPPFTLFVTRDRKAEHWLAWSPFGPHVYSDRNGERWLGWHFNHTCAGETATFSMAAEQYHKEFFREGILRHLLAEGAISLALQEWEKEELREPLPRPVMKPWINGVMLGDDRAVLRARRFAC